MNEVSSIHRHARALLLVSNLRPGEFDALHELCRTHSKSAILSLLDMGFARNMLPGDLAEATIPGLSLEKAPADQKAAAAKLFNQLVEGLKQVMTGQYARPFLEAAVQARGYATLPDIVPAPVANAYAMVVLLSDILGAFQRADGTDLPLAFYARKLSVSLDTNKG